MSTSKAKRDEIKAKALQRECPKCKSHPGTVCQSPEGRPIYFPHKERQS